MTEPSDNTAFAYEPDTQKHVYGKTDRWPGERLFVKSINQMREEYPTFQMMLLGTSGVSGEAFPLFKTKCHFQLSGDDALHRCMIALKESDELIRRRVDPLWRWDSAWRDGNQILFFVNWYDFAFFMKNKEIFRAKDHARYALDFGLDVKTIAFEHYKIFRNGELAVFDLDLISADERKVVRRLDDIHFPRDFRNARF